jgi:NitT/TauT family transport system ATP-binding protein
MDEPFGALDALTREQMNLDLQRTWLSEGCTVVFITHSIEEAVMLSDRVVVMSKGPGRITEVNQIATPRPRGMSSRQDPHFVAAVEAIRRNFMALGILSEA